MITWEDVLQLRQAIPPRQPRGSPENRARIGPGLRFTAALAQYQLEHGQSWFGQPGRDYNVPRTTICKRCNKEVQHVSRKGICQGCAGRAMLDAATQLHAKSGPMYEKWLARMKAGKKNLAIAQGLAPRNNEAKNARRKT